MNPQQTESSTSRQPLPERWVAKIFQAMQGNYGTRFLNQWKTGQVFGEGHPKEGEDVGLVNAMAFWGEKLSGFSDQPERIRRVLDSLPPEPPSLPQFVDLCRLSRGDEKPALPHRPTQAEIDHQREMSKRIGDAIGAGKLKDGIDAHWATHPRSVAHLRAIFEASNRDPRFMPCIAQMVSDGICTANGQLLKAYQNGSFYPVLRAAA